MIFYIAARFVGAIFVFPLTLNPCRCRGGGGGQKGKEFSEHHGESCYSQVKPQPNNVNKLSDIHKRSY